MKLCTIPNCGRHHLSSGLCSTHYARFRKYGDALVAKPIEQQTKKPCKVAGCNRVSKARGYCDTHYARLRRVDTVSETVPVAYSKPGELNANWKGGVISDGHRRVLIYAPDHPYPNRKRTHVYRYRLVVEKHLGRFLSPEEVVHHINEDPSDDRLENLKIMTQSEHMKLHQEHRKKSVGCEGGSATCQWANN